MASFSALAVGGTHSIILARGEDIVAGDGEMVNWGGERSAVDLSCPIFRRPLFEVAQQVSRKKAKSPYHSSERSGNDECFLKRKMRSKCWLIQLFSVATISRHKTLELFLCSTYRFWTAWAQSISCYRTMPLQRVYSGQKPSLIFTICNNNLTRNLKTCFFSPRRYHWGKYPRAVIVRIK